MDDATTISPSSVNLISQPQEEKKQTAKKRWKILAQILNGGNVSEIAENSISVRRFQSYGLLSTTVLFEEPAIATWFLYTCLDLPGFEMKIRHLTGSISASKLNGFNNTGNVCVWPSEEVMTFYCMQNVEKFKGQKICELGGGMTCLAGIALGMYSEADHVEVSDGNEDSVDNLEQIINKNDFGSTTIGARLLRWGSDPLDENLCCAFDKVICADCLFFDDGRESLSQLLHDLLKPGGEALLFAPSRNETFYKFMDIAQQSFNVTKEDKYDTRIWDIHSKMLQDSADMYDESLHFPLMMKLVKPLTQPNSRDVTPESR